ncbi:cationic amino acid transporter 3 [Vanessa atalanta]|uniref:cationic amino acid transporter 3 n=1 Tax=Vanessa atalanta TaxID=42275 RepID=UPI001FCDD00D|nr:cationic amino acid transporter 3 [Vanessa atalanta]XP_047533229.1 cationic amino acid transporter 3 [Vanessa atalanta]XP_047533230.1 cationic amino acid transporter 3 [Vanessa atalanta]
MGCAKILSALRRCKQLDADGDNSTPLSRCLGLVDLTALGVGSTLGLGVYVLAGSVAKTEAGPAVTLSFLVAAIASAFAGLCYAEFAARVPKAGSAYVYSYVSVGEFIAFTIGWNLILEYVIGTASVAKGMANYIDSLFNNTMAITMRKMVPINISFLANYPDFLAFGLVLLITILLCVGVKESTKLNNVFTALNLATVVIVIIAGAINSDPANWRIKVEDIPEEYRSQAGDGGFMPWGVAGVMAGAAKCFFGFVGFDCVATTGEEAKNPKRDIPLSIVISLAVIFASYFSIATVLTMMWPYYLQDADAPFPHVFTQTGMPVIMWIVTVGAVFALCTSLLGAMFPLPRVLYAMGTDGVLFRPLSLIDARTQTPLLATLLSGLFAAIMSAIFNLNQLIDMMSIGTLLAYTIVATSVLILRYEEENIFIMNGINAVPETIFSIVKQTLNLLGLKHPTALSSTIAKCTIGLLFVAALVACALLRWAGGGPGALCAALLLLVLLLVLYRQPRASVQHLSFKVPLVPLVPYLSVCMNVYLMMQLDYQTWVRFIFWLVIGYAIYFTYGIRNSSLREGKSTTNNNIVNEKQVITKF